MNNKIFNSVIFKTVFCAVFFFLCLSAPMFVNAQSTGLSFADAGRIAVEASEDLRHQEAMLALQRDVWKWGRRAYFPKLSISAYEDDRLDPDGPDSFQKNYALSLEQLVFDGGRLATSRKIEKAKFATRAAGLESAKSDIYEEALGIYRSILLGRETLAIRKRGLDSLEAERRVLAVKLELGMALPAEFAEFDISIADSKIAILMSELELAETEQQFAEMLGMETLPTLIEKIDINRKAIHVNTTEVCSAAQARNPELLSARLAIKEKEEETRLAARSWLPSIKANGSFIVRGSRYPLTQHTWQAGLTLEFDTPFLSGSSGLNFGYEGRKTKTARLQGQLTPLSNPAGWPALHEPQLTLSLERSKFELLFERTGRNVKIAIERCRFSEEKLLLAKETSRLAEARFALVKVKYDLGQLTGIELLDAQTERIQKEIALAEAAAQLLAEERALEKLMDLRPGELLSFSKDTQKNQS
jgi:outer membrane protein TolC